MKDNPFASKSDDSSGPSFTDRVASDRNAAVKDTLDKAIAKPVEAMDPAVQQHLQDMYVNPSALQDHLLSGEHQQEYTSVSHALNHKLHEKMHGTEYKPTWKQDDGKPIDGGKADTSDGSSDTKNPFTEARFAERAGILTEVGNGNNQYRQNNPAQSKHLDDYTGGTRDRLSTHLTGAHGMSEADAHGPGSHFSSLDKEHYRRHGAEPRRGAIEKLNPSTRAGWKSPLNQDPEVELDMYAHKK